MTTVAIIGGSGAYDLLAAGSLGNAKKVRVIKTPFGKVSNIRKFEGEEFSFYFLSRHGDDGYKIAAPFVNYRANIWALKSLGTERILSWSGPGVINPEMEVGSYAVPDDIIDMTKSRPSTFFEKGGLGFIRMNTPFCPDLRHGLLFALEAQDLPRYDRGTYLCTEGPRLETPAEIKLYYSYGADLVGMTLVPEAFLARELEICYASICYLTNYAEGVAARDYRQGALFEGMQTEEEKNSVEAAVERLPEIATQALKAVAGHPRECNCKDAMLRYKNRGDIGDDWRTWIDP